MLMTIKPIIPITDKLYIQGKQDDQIAPDAVKLINTACLMSLALCKLNHFRRQSVVFHLDKSYNADGILYADLSKSVKEARTLSSLSKSIESKRGMTARDISRSGNSHKKNRPPNIKGKGGNGTTTPNKVYGD